MGGAVKRPVDVYVRVSRVGGREHLISPDEQERRGRELATERGLTVGEVIRDLDESGGKWERPGLQRALERVRAGQSGGLIVAWLDRLSRDSEHAHRLVREIHELGGAIYAPDAPSDWTSPEGELQAGIVFTFAQYVRKRARASFERAKENAVAQGIPIHSRPPVGYRKRADRRLEPDPKTAPVVRDVFERRAAGAGPSELADLLTARGVQTSQGSQSWSKQAVASLIASRVYLGEIAYGRDRRFVNARAHEPLVDLATWTAAQHPRGRRLQEARRGGYALTGLVRCASCGYCLQGTRTSAERGSKRRYRCVGRHAGGQCPAPVSAFADEVEEVAFRLFWQHAETVALRGTAMQPDDDRPRLEAELERAERRLAQALTTEAQDAAADAWPELVRARRRARDEAAAQLGAARAEASRATSAPRVADLRALWPEMSAAERREIIATYFDCFALRRAQGIEIVAFASGSGPIDLSAPGFRREPKLRPIDIPLDARVATLHDVDEGSFEATA